MTATEINIGQAPIVQQTQTITVTNPSSTKSVDLPSDRTNTVYELKQFIDVVNDGKVCISSTKDSLKLAWNPETIVK